MPIKILPAMLANQIAAGEVVERPASVVKEIVENSLDAGATKIEIDIDKGGHKRICVRDNGCGIAEQELVLALSRHATSKIADLDDLEHIASLGFRGEALASISSVARLTLTSCTEQQSAAWQAYAEGRDMQVVVKPAAHPVGTTVDVQDLFFNTPARRKFLRAEKTEFTHIDEWLRRIALSRYDIQFILRHNGKIVRNYPAATETTQQRKRLAMITHKGFADAAMAVQSQFDTMTLSGHVYTNRDTQFDVQYFYVNGRVMRDKLLNHAIRQASAEFFGDQHHLAYVLYLTLPAEQVDINVHPAKHEVRFHQTRQVHDFLYRALMDVFQRESELVAEDAQDGVLAEAAPEHDYIVPIERQRHVQESPSSVSRAPQQSRHGSSPSRQAVSQYQHLLSSPAAKPALDELQWLVSHDGWLLVSGETLQKLPASQLIYWHLDACLEQGNLVSQPLLMPLSVNIDAVSDNTDALIEQWQQFGIHLARHQRKVILRQVPACLRQFNWSTLLPALLDVDIASLGALIDRISSTQQRLTRHLLTPLWLWGKDYYGEQWAERLRHCATRVNLGATDDN